MALTIPDHEYDLCMELARPGYTVLGLVNDLYSWRKERDAAEQAGQDYVFNAIWVIMRERSVSEDEAKAVCADEIRRYTSEYQEIVEKAKKDPSLSKDTRAYLVSSIFLLLWSHALLVMGCSRAHRLETFTRLLTRTRRQCCSAALGIWFGAYTALDTMRTINSVTETQK